VEGFIHEFVRKFLENDSNSKAGNYNKNNLSTELSDYSLIKSVK